MIIGAGAAALQSQPMQTRTLLIGMTLVMTAAFAGAQGTPNRPASPPGSSATQLGPNGKWLEITYGRPIRRGRVVWGRGAD
jgi:hypothetical protein